MLTHREVNNVLLGKDLSQSRNSIPSIMMPLLSLLFVFLINLPPATAFPALTIGKFTVSTLLVCGLIYLCVIIFLAKRQLLYGTRADFFMFVLTVLTFMMTSHAIPFLLITLMPYFLGKLLSQYDISEGIKWMIRASGLIQAALVIRNPFHFEATAGRDLFKDMSTQTDLSSFRAFGTIGHPIVLAALLLPSFICWFEFLFTTAKKRLKLLTVAICLLHIYCIYATFSRSVWIAMAFCTILLLMKKQVMKRRGGVFFSLIVVFFGYFFGGQYKELITQRFSALSLSDGSFSHRMYMYHWTWDKVHSSAKHFFLGFGFNSSPGILRAHPPIDKFLVIDNMYLTYFLEYGLIGLMTIAALLFLVIKRFRKSTVDASLIIILFSFIMEGFTFDLTTWEETGIFFWLLIGYILNKQNASQIEKRAAH